MRIVNITYDGQIYTAYEYDQELTHKGYNYFKSTLDGLECKCVVCNVYVTPGPISMTHSEYMRIDPPTNQFTEIISGFSENNTHYDPIYRIYPKDEYGNKIDTITDLSGYTATLTHKTESVSYTLKLNPQVTTPTDYIEFIKNDKALPGITWKNLNIFQEK